MSSQSKQKLPAISSEQKVFEFADQSEELPENVNEFDEVSDLPHMERLYLDMRKLRLK